MDEYNDIDSQWNQQAAAQKAAQNHFQSSSVQNTTLQPTGMPNDSSVKPSFADQLKDTSPPISSYQGSMNFGGNRGKGLSTLNNVYNSITGSPLINSSSATGSVLSALVLL
jgi:hypothetical protein